MSNEVCKECNEKNPSDSLYCQNCGRRLINSQFYDIIRFKADDLIAKNKIRDVELNKAQKPKDISELLNFKIGFSDDPNIVKEYHEKRFNPILEESIMLNYNYTDEIKKGLIKDLNDGMLNQLMPYDKAKKLSLRLGNFELAQKIEHEETMRASNMSSWIQAKSEGLNYFFVDFCNNEKCINKYKYTYFDIDNVEDLPPLYTDCGCVPYYYDTIEEVENDGREISDKNLQEYVEERKKYEEPYATGYIAYNLAEDKIKNFKEVNAENNQYLNIIPLLERALEENISDYTQARVYRILGDIYYKNDNIERAVENYEKALSINPKVGVKRLYDKLKSD